MGPGPGLRFPVQAGLGLCGVLKARAGSVQLAPGHSFLLG